MTRSALVVGVSGIVGNNVAQHLLQQGGWQVSGLARRPYQAVEGLLPIAADLRDPPALRAALAEVRPTHVFLCTWSREETEAENIRVNGAMIRNVLDAVRPSGSVEHVGLITGLKHYLGPIEEFAKHPVVTPFRETQPRLEFPNFYYEQEDQVYAASARDGFSWSVHRPHTMIGYAINNAMNFATTLAVYASICRETGRPFVFPGSAAQWNSLVDMTDARILARHVEWAATTPETRNQAFNIVNGDIFRWNWMWSRVADWFGLRPAPFPAKRMPLEEQLADAGPIWAKIALKHDLVEPDLSRLSTAWASDLDLGRPMECVVDMTKSRKLGFLDYRATDEAFFDLFVRLRHERIIPADRSADRLHSGEHAVNRRPILLLLVVDKLQE
jgi:nucleoside-diphosphate-sugar epimerase